MIGSGLQRFSLSLNVCHKQEDKTQKTKNFSLVDHIVLNSFHFNPEYPDQTINKIPIRKGQWRGQKIKSFEITIKYWETFQLKSNISNSSPF